MRTEPSGPCAKCGKRHDYTVMVLHTDHRYYCRVCLYWVKLEQGEK